jgi:hypothetical protein
MTMQPLTHHEILGLVEPFTRQGRHVDLAASNRLERRLVFKPIEYADAPGMRETLQLENPEANTLRLTRILTLDCGLQATLETEGEQAAELLLRIESVARQRQLQSGVGFMVAQSYRLQAGQGSPESRMVLTQGTAQVGGLMVILKAETVKGYASEFELVAKTGDSIELPEDLLAVLGREWSCIERVRERWSGKLMVRGAEPTRSRSTEQYLQRMVNHLAQTLAESPRRFHDRLFWARWGVTGRRAIPLVGAIALTAGAAAVPYLSFAQESLARMLIFNAPPLLMAMFFCMKEMPRLEIPPLPRALRAPTWRTPNDAMAGAQPLLS